MGATITMKIRTYTELISLPTFMDRYEYLRLGGVVGEETFGFDRIFNQRFYTSSEWRLLRNQIISRDLGRDLGVEGFDIPEGVRITIHHMNPISIDDIVSASEFLLNPEYLITTTDITHKAIHYGDASLLVTEPIQRVRFDTCLWRKN